MKPPIRKHKVIACPDCGAKMAHVSGCRICYECGFSYCG